MIERTGYNNLKLTAYSSGSTPVIHSGLDNAQGLNFRTFYPGGVYADCTFFVPMDVVASITSWQVRVGQRIKAFNGLKSVYEGAITGIAPSFAAGAEGATVTAIGFWGDKLQNEMLRKPWADTRSGRDAWVIQDTAGSTEDLFDITDDFGNIHMMPKETVFASGDYASVKYTAPTGQTLKKVVYDYDFSEPAGQAWEMLLYNVTAAGTEAGSSVTATGTGTHTLTLGTPSQSVELRYYARATINATLDKHAHAKWNSIVVYTETSAINLTEIAKDVRALAGDLSADETEIDSNTFSLVPFVADPPMYLSDILNAATKYGDSSYNAWACCVRNSDLSSDDKPILCVEQQPALTDYEYAVRLDDPNVESGITFEQDLTGVINDVIVSYRDSEGRTVYITSADDATLKDTTSITNYGTRQSMITLPTESATTAANYGRRVLAKYKDAQWRASSDLVVRGYIMGKNGQRVPVSEIEAGQRVTIANYLNDLSGTGLTFVISMTNYDDTQETCSLSLGAPDNLDVTLARMEVTVRL